MATPATTQLQVKDAMTRDPFTIDPEAPVATAVEVMRERGLRHLPVIDEAGRLVGMLSDSDLRCAMFAPALAEHLSASARRRLRGLSEAFENLRVKDVMSWDALTIGPEALLAQAAAIMYEAHVGSLPVVENGRLVAIVTERDVLKMLARTLRPVRGIDPDTYLW